MLLGMSCIFSARTLSPYRSAASLLPIAATLSSLAARPAASALLDAETGADVVFGAHWGFDGIRSFYDFLGGGLIDRTIEVEFWRVPAERIPEDRDAQIGWLYDHWSRVDDWVGLRSEADAMATTRSRVHPSLG